MTGLPRYAIYFAAGSNSALSRFGAELLGYDAHTGNELPFPSDTLHAAPDWRDITADPRKYGFHGTLKAPMALAPGTTEAELLAGLRNLCRRGADDSGDPADRRFHQWFYCGHSGRAGRCAPRARR
ncbi:hypothetical protein ACVWWP_001044 [Bradyrhizobium sp. LM3.6]